MFTHRFGKILSSILLSTTMLTGGMLAIGSATPASAAAKPIPACKLWVRLIDVSSNQPHPIVWWKVAKSGVAGAYIKTTEGTQYTNPYFLSDLRQARSYGIPWGGYDFALPGLTDPIKDAKYFVQAGGARGELPPALDLETMGHGNLQTLKWVLAWMGEVKKLSHRDPILYSGDHFPIIMAPQLNQWALWLSAYSNRYAVQPVLCSLALPKVPTPWALVGWSIWQYSSRTLVPGIGGGVDGDAANQFWFQAITGAGIQPPSKTNPNPVPIYAPGSHGVAVKYVQNLLKKHNLLPTGWPIGNFDLETKRALEAYQNLIGVPHDGLWGPTTILGNAWWNKYKRPAGFTNALIHSNYPVIHQGIFDVGQVNRIQTFLIHAGYKTVKIDGVFGTSTRVALIAFQKNHHIKRTAWGATSYATWIALWNSYNK